MPNLEPFLGTLFDALGTDRAESVLSQLDRYSNQPNAVKGAAKRPSDPEIELAALRVFEGADPRSTIDALDSIAMWGLLTLAARADAAILERLPSDISASPKVASIRRAAAKHRKEQQSATPAPARRDAVTTMADRPVLPAKVSEVGKWLAAHPDTDPRVFAPHPGQRAAARRSALRALGAMATPAALEVLAEYAAPEYSDADLAELHRAWGRFDRRAFAAAMFGAGASGLRLDVCSTIEGIGAVEGLTALDVILTKRADLTPLEECADLRRLRIHATIGSGLTSVEPLTRLPHLAHLELIGITRGADLTVLRNAPIEQLYLHLDGADGAFLSELPRLRSLKLSCAYETHSAFEEPDDAPESRPAHPGSAGTVVDLVRAGVTVVLYRHEAWVPPFIASAPEDVSVAEANGFVRLSLAAEAPARRAAQRGQ